MATAGGGGVVVVVDGVWVVGGAIEAVVVTPAVDVVVDAVVLAESVVAVVDDAVDGADAVASSSPPRPARTSPMAATATAPTSVTPNQTRVRRGLMIRRWRHRGLGGRGERHIVDDRSTLGTGRRQRFNRLAKDRAMRGGTHMSLLHRAASEVAPGDTGLTRWFAEFPAVWPWLEDRGPRVEEFVENGTVVVRFEMPGLDPDKDVEVTVSDGVLRIKAERREEVTPDDKSGYRSEFRYGSYTRAVALPVGATDDDVKATYRDGILEVRVPVTGSNADARRVPIARG
jgi:HSP20 family protein